MRLVVIQFELSSARETRGIGKEPLVLLKRAPSALAPTTAQERAGLIAVLVMNAAAELATEREA